MMSESLMTKNVHWGFWGIATRNGYDPDLCWKAAADALVTAFDLKPNEVRALLDSRCGRHVADDLSFVEGDQTQPKQLKTI